MREFIGKHLVDFVDPLYIHLNDSFSIEEKKRFREQQICFKSKHRSKKVNKIKEFVKKLINH